MERIYTMEVYRPCFPYQGKPIARVHNGRFNENRDCFNPSMMFTREFYAVSKSEALKKVQALCRETKEYKFSRTL